MKRLTVRKILVLFISVGIVLTLVILKTIKSPTVSSPEISAGDTMRVGLLGRPSSLNIYRAKDLNVHVVLNAIHRGLVQVNHLGQIESALAESWKIDRANRRIDFKLNDFSKCADFVRGVRRAQESIRTPLAVFDPICLDKEEILRFENVLDAESLFPLLGRVYFAAMPAGHLNDLVHGKGYGPFKLVKEQPDHIRIERKKVEPSRPSAIDFKIYNSVPEGVKAFQRAEIDVLPIVDSASLEPDLLRYVHTSPIFSTVWFLSFGNKHVASSQTRYRSCFNASIDRGAIVKALNQNGIEFAVPAFSMLSGHSRMAEFRPMLRSIGCPRLSRKPVEITFSRESASQAALAVIFKNLENMGFAPTSRPLDKKSYVEAIASGNYDLVFGGFSASDSLRESLLTYYAEKTYFKFVPDNLRLTTEDSKKYFTDSPIDEGTIFELQAELWRRAGIIPLYYMRPATLVRGCFELEASTTHNPILNIDSVQRRAKCEDG